jgi:hypothetical protein
MPESAHNGGYACGDREQRWSRCAIIFAWRKRTDRRLCAGLKAGYALSWRTQRRRPFFLHPAGHAPRISRPGRVHAL